MAKSRIGESYVQGKITFDGMSDSIASEMAKGFQQASSEIDSSVTAAGEETGQKSGSATAKGLVAGLAAAGLATQIASMFSDAISEAVNQANQNSKIEAKFNLDSAQTENSIKAIDELYKAGIGGTREDISNTMGAIVGTVKGAKDLNSEDLTEMARNVQNLSSTYDLSSEEITRSANSMVNNGMAKDFNEATSMILSGYQTMGGAGDDWLDSLNEYSDDFNKFGLNGADAINFVNSAIDAGAINTDKIGDALNEMSITVMDGSIDDTIKAMGMDPDDLRARIAEGGDSAQGALMEILTNLQKDGNVANYQKFMSSMGEDFQSVFQNMDLTNLNSGLAEGVGNLEKLDSTLNTGISTSLQQIQREWQAAFVDAVTPILTALTPILIETAQWVSENSWVLGALAVVLGVVLVAALIASTLALFSFAAAGWAALAPMLPVIGTIALVVAAVIAVIAIIWLLVSNWDAVWGWISNTASGVGNWFVGLWNGIIQWFGEAWNGFANWFGELWNGIGEFFTGVWTGIGEFFTGLWTGLVNFFIGIYNTVINLVNDILNAMSSVANFGTFGAFDFNFSQNVGLSNAAYMANGGTVPARPGGTLAVLGEAGRAEVVMDSGKWNNLLDNINSKGFSSSANGSVTFNITQKENESTEDLVQRINEHLDFNGLRG